MGHGGANRANTPGRYFVMQKIHPQDFLMRTGAASPGSLLLSCPPPLFHSSTREEVLLLLSGSVIVFTAIRSLFAQQLCNLRGTLALSYSLETIPSAKACHKVKSRQAKGRSYRLGSLSYLLTYLLTLRYSWKSRRCLDRSMVWEVNLVYLLGVRNSPSEVGLYKHHTSSPGITVVPLRCPRSLNLMWALL